MTREDYSNEPIQWPNPAALYLVKNEDKEREIKATSAAEVKEILSKGESIGIVATHISTVTNTLLQTLLLQVNSDTIDEILVIDEKDLPQNPIRRFNPILGQIHEFKNEKMLITPREEMTEIFLNIPQENYKEKNIANFHKYHTPQKLKNDRWYKRKHIQRKK